MKQNSVHPGGEPYGCVVGDYEFSNHPADVEDSYH